ncbi:MAG: bifunctional 3-(3-hydroxy-phenyl)propionate/3-hydroxycinnamic acid hydroxylase [Rhizobiaceae bacterium]
MKEPEAPQRYDVAIVGLGPTGATLANLLGLCGLSVVAFDRFDAPYPLPRAVHFDDEVMRSLQTIGVADEIASNLRVNVGMRFVDDTGELLLDWPRPQEIGPHGWHASYRFHQPDLERTLRKALGRFAGVDLMTGREVRQVTERGDHVVIEHTGSDDMAAEQASAAYVVGCDGANSLVRRTMDVGETDLGFNERWLVVDLLLDRPKPELGDHTIQYCSAERPATYARGPANRRRFEFALSRDEDADAMSRPETVWRLLQRWLAPDEARLERAAVYTFQSIVADTWRAGRLMIAGDAAHRTPPFMGQGMCAGIRDAANLAWKLTLVARGRAPAALLDSYGAERRPHALEYVATAMRLGRLVNASGGGQALEAAFAGPDGAPRMQSIAPRLGPGLGGGDRTLTGTLFPQPRLADGGRLDDRTGYRFVLVVDGAFWRRAPTDIRARAGKSDLRIVDADDHHELAAWLEAHDTRAVLVRPDRYILGTAGGTDQLGELLSAVPAV